MHSLWATIMQSRQGKEDMDQFSDCWASPSSFATKSACLIRRFAPSPRRRFASYLPACFSSPLSACYG
jgi:hypothetical protein